MVAFHAFPTASGETIPELFIDRSPMYFTLILDWMRTDMVPALPPSIGQRNLIEEARYYGLPRLVHDLEHLLYRPTRFELYQLMLAKDLSQTDLSGMSLRGRNLSGFRLDGANLSNADLTEADLTLATVRRPEKRAEAGRRGD